ncbi:uncharacterized protein H6S33_005643 [Morchella sextelata]|uniref:uncharacterized protein n=1 Tax=Morchella sextelata TaxID=1174677 RepID=UPI001D057190|nr:uncharacterized protein H6S33_005643 [Morchella sextelata]KAH0613757.1 hypothetical protein H6S33_005643 [Morchella sextelata]
MVQLFNTLVLTAAVLGTAAYAQITAECGVGLGSCPSDKPCCSQYGVCGVGAYCLGGCDPKHSATIDSCAPAPMCKNIDSTFSNLDRIADKTKYLGDSTKADWVADGEPTIYDNQLLLTMAPETVGTVLASTTYVWYGKISATLKTSRGKGVVSAFILLSDMKDEIDYEWIGVDLDTAQTNFYWQGVPNYTNGGNITLSEDTYNNFHTYEIDWTPDTVTWSVDGQVGRVLKKSDTYNSTTKQYNYPQTPARVQLSLWPGGLASNAPGTIAWAGGEIDWDSQDIKDNGYYYVTFKEVKIECYDPPSDAQKDGSGSVSYIYDDAAGYESNVVMTDKGTVMKSFLGTGKNMTAALPASKTSSGASPSATDVETIPGLTGAGTGANGLRGEEDSSTTTGSASSSSETAASGSSDFVQQQQGSGADSVRIGGVVTLIAAVFVGAVAL